MLRGRLCPGYPAHFTGFIAATAGLRASAAVLGNQDCYDGPFGAALQDMRNARGDEEGRHG